MRCNTYHDVVGVLGSQARHVRGMLWESWGTFGRSWAVMWCFGMRHISPVVDDGRLCVFGFVQGQ